MGKWAEVNETIYKYLTEGDHALEITIYNSKLYTREAQSIGTNGFNRNSVRLNMRTLFGYE